MVREILEQIKGCQPKHWCSFRAILACLITGLVFTAWIHAQSEKIAKPNPMTQEDVQRGMAQFQQTCAMCHGTQAKGASGPNLIESSLVRHDNHGDLIGKVIREGRPVQGMPASPSFSEAQVADIVAFLHASVEVSDNRGSEGPARGYSLHRLLTGDVVAGKRFFDGEGGCSKCHSTTGDLNGIAKKYSPVDLEHRILYPPDGTKMAVVSLPSGETIKGRLLHLDTFYISLIDAEGNYRSWPLRFGASVAVEDPLRGHRELLKRYKDKDIHDIFAYLETLQ